MIHEKCLKESSRTDVVGVKWLFEILPKLYVQILLLVIISKKAAAFLSDPLEVLLIFESRHQTIKPAVELTYRRVFYVINEKTGTMLLPSLKS